MKFQIKESQTFNTAIEEAGLDRSVFTFTKKSGWLNIKHSDSQKTFHYHRKREIKLSEDGSWDKGYSYYIKLDSVKKECTSFDEVADVFKEWLSSI